MKAVNGKPLTIADPDLIIYSYACLTGWACHCIGVTTRGPWGADDKNRHINELELIAAFNCLKSSPPPMLLIYGPSILRQRYSRGVREQKRRF